MTSLSYRRSSTTAALSDTWQALPITSTWGGGAPASIGAFREIYQEGVIIPPVKFMTGGQINRDVFDLVLAQVRAKRETAGDFRAQIAANNTGIRRITALLDRMGVETVKRYVDELIEYTNRRTRAELAKLPRGVYASEGYLDSDGYTEAPVFLAVRVTIDEDGLLFDFTGSDPQRRAPVNSTYAQTYSGVAFVLKCLIDPDVPVNEGFYRNVRMVAPEGAVVNCTEPHAVVGGWGDSHALGRHHLQGAGSGHSRDGAGWHGGDDLPLRLRRLRPLQR